MSLHAPGTVIVISTTSMPPATMHSTAREARPEWSSQARHVRRRIQNTEAALREIQPVASGASNSVVWRPAYIGLRDTPLKHQIFDEPADGVVGQRRDDGGLQSEAAFERTSHVVFSAALPGAEGP